MSTRMTRRVAIVSAELTNPYYPELVEPVRQFLEEAGYRSVVVTDHEVGDVGLEALVDGSYDGVILTTTTRRSTLPRDLTERGIPHVLANRMLDHPESPSCGIANAEGSAAVAELLVELGHTRIGLIAGPVETSTGRERANGLRRTLRAHGIIVRREMTRRCVFTHDAGMAAAEDLLLRRDRPTALVCGNDVIALGALSAARRVGVEVPAQVSVIGFDDIRMARWPTFDLTTVRCDLVELARRTVRMLCDQMAGGCLSAVETRLSPSLVLRGTHGPSLC
ncbi:substrate-binding domain-containing protein [Saccharomonospora sp. NPDC046836]|uniref:substrate-binding domain-containing protein n=1 Tax=Saccharomonospora sp. NPDC046836 TaxID=3156921 RepID=UPI00340968BB